MSNSKKSERDKLKEGKILPSKHGKGKSGTKRDSLPPKKE